MDPWKPAAMGRRNKSAASAPAWMSFPPPLLRRWAAAASHAWPCGLMEAGAGTRVKPGDRVSPLFAQGWLEGPPTMTHLGGPVDGVARTHAAFDAESLVVVPDELGDLEAATLPCAGLTAWSALFGARPLQRGEWILVQGTGGVSIAALQWAKAAGANVVVTSSSDAKLRRAKALGA